MARLIALKNEGTRWYWLGETRDGRLVCGATWGRDTALKQLYLVDAPAVPLRYGGPAGVLTSSYVSGPGRDGLRAVPLADLGDPWANGPGPGIGDGAIFNSVI